ncbi:MAG: ABC transporter substrate-binding protein [Kiloniellaceae bacterium]
MIHFALRSLLAAAAVVSCSFATVVPAAEAQQRTSVAVVAPWHVSGMEPSQDGYTYLRMQTGETLVGADLDGKLVPVLATQWGVSDDGLTWTFTLRQGVSFHDGTPLTVAAAVASLQRASGKPGVFGMAPIERIEAADNAVVIRLKRPYAALPAVLANYTAMILAPASFDAAGEVTQFIATGPFEVAELNAPQSMTVRRFDGYWGAAPAIETASYLSSHRAETRALMVESGDADLAFTLDPAGYSRLKALDDVDVQVKPIPRVIVVKLNIARAPLADSEARRALSLAIDRAGIAAGILRFPEAAASQLFPPAVAGWHNPDLAPLTHDPEAARRILADLGWKPGSDGILERDGVRFALTLRTFPNRPELPLIAAALQDQWRQIGVALDVSVGNSSEIPAGHQDGSLDMGLYARNYGLTPDPVVNAMDDFGSGGGDWGAMNWDAPAVAAALETASGVSDMAQRVPAIATVTEALQVELPLIPIAWYQQTVAHPAALKGVAVDPLERTYGLSDLRWAE